MNMKAKEANPFKENNLSALDSYTNRVFKLVVLMMVAAGFCASTVFTLAKAFNWYPNISWGRVIVFDCCNLVYCVLGIILPIKGLDSNGLLKPDSLKLFKIIMIICIVFQWNLISYFFPSSDFWGYSFFFVLLIVFFFDTKMVDTTALAIFVSMIISWFINDKLLPVHDELFVLNIILRIVCVLLSYFCLHFLTYFGSHILVKELEEISDYDALTNLLNRRQLDSYLNKAYEEAQKGTSRLTIAMVDLDNFKDINDNYGHENGDKVLKEVSEIIKRSVRQDDLIFRWGGEEFLILFKCELTPAINASERIVKNLEMHEYKFNNRSVAKVTATIGLSTYNGRLSIQGMFEEADKNLFKGKKSGKNKVVF